MIALTSGPIGSAQKPRCRRSPGLESAAALVAWPSTRDRTPGPGQNQLELFLFVPHRHTPSSLTTSQPPKYTMAEPLEANLFPIPQAEDERYRMEGAENAQDVALGRAATRVHSGATAVDAEAYGSEKLNIVRFEHGKGEDPREFSNGKKWRVSRVLFRFFLC